MLTLCRISVLIACLSTATSEPPSTSYGVPVTAPLSSYGTPNYHASDNGNGNGNGNQHDHGYNNEEPKSYEFGYQVKDDYTGTHYNQKESSDGNQVRGEYRVALPDGRTQIVTYWADWQSGFHADVRYEGEAHYPEQYNKGGSYNGDGGGGYNNGGYSNGATSGQQHGSNGYNNDYSGSSSGINSAAINNLASGNGNYDSYNTGFNNKAPPSNVYGAV